MIATNGKWNEDKFDMKKIQSLDEGALVLWRAFGLTEVSQTFCYENWQILMNESAFHFCGRWILTTTVFHITKSTTAGGIPDFFRVCICQQETSKIFELKSLWTTSTIGNFSEQSQIRLYNS
jgi:hypothetical protein